MAANKKERPCRNDMTGVIDGCVYPKNSEIERTLFNCLTRTTVKSAFDLSKGTIAKIRTTPLFGKLIRECVLKVYPGLPHGMCSTHKDRINADLFDFIKQ